MAHTLRRGKVTARIESCIAFASHERTTTHTEPTMRTVYVPVILSVVLLQAIYVSAAPPDWIPPEMLEMVQGDKRRCMEQHGTSQALIDEVNDGKLTDDRSISCYMNCLLDAFSLVDEEGDLETDMLIGVLPEQYQEIGTKILTKCAKQDGDPCEKIYKIAKCVQGTVPELWFMV